MLEAETLEEAIKSTLKELEVATTAQIHDRVKDRFPNASTYKVHKILSESKNCAKIVAKIGFNDSRTGYYEKDTPAWKYVPKKEKKVRDQATEIIHLIAYRDQLSNVLLEYVENCKSHNDDPNPFDIEYFQKLLETVRLDLVADNLGNKKIANDIREIQDAIEELYKLNEPFYLEDQADEEYENLRRRE